MAKRSPNYLKAALLMPANWFALVAGGIASAVLGDWTPLIAASGASALYLGLLSALPSFRRAVHDNLELQAGGAAPQELDSLMAELSPSQKEHYLTLKELRD